MNKYRTTMLLTLAFMTGCVSTMQSEMSQWEGKTIDDVSAAWGAPESTMLRSDGGTTYTWSNHDSKCNKNFVTDSKGNIVSWSTKSCNLFVTHY
jgi:hypothetical protein